MEKRPTCVPLRARCRRAVRTRRTRTESRGSPPTGPSFPRALCTPLRSRSRLPRARPSCASRRPRRTRRGVRHGKAPDGEKGQPSFAKILGLNGRNQFFKSQPVLTRPGVRCRKAPDRTRKDEPYRDCKHENQRQLLEMIQHSHNDRF